MEWSRSAQSRGVGGKPLRKVIAHDERKRIQTGIASDDEGEEVFVFSEKEEAAMAKIYDKVKAKMPADPPAADDDDDAPPPTAPAPSATIPSSATTTTATAPTSPAIATP